VVEKKPKKPPLFRLELTLSTYHYNVLHGAYIELKLLTFFGVLQRCFGIDIKLSIGENSVM